MPIPAASTASAPDEPALRRAIRDAVEEALGADVEGLFLFGSRARGDASPDSDWDVLAMLRDDVDWFAARAALRRLRGRLMVDWGESVHLLALRWKDADEHGGLIRNVAREGQRL